MNMRTTFRLLIVCISLLSFTTQIYAQDLPKDWHLLDNTDDNYAGISLKKAYQLLKESGRKSSTVIVAVLDSGLDIDHEDITSILWKNKKEKPGNGKDDDGNGYIDDVNGWNFIGGKDGSSLDAETLELTRLYRKYLKQFEGKNKFTITANEQEDYQQYLKFKQLFTDGRDKLATAITRNQEEFNFFDQMIPPLKTLVGKDMFSAEELKKAKIKTEQGKRLRASFFRIIDRNKEQGLTAEGLIEHYDELSGRMEELKKRLEFNYSLDFDGRAIIKDDVNNLTEKFYGNNDVTVRSEHGTHVSGIIAAMRHNNIGMDGIADNVLIMPVRTTPMGDELDKDVANGIIYAVDNGAQIINMSFGKDFSPNKELVDKAVQYAKEKGVLLIHAAGNDSKNTDYFYNFPTALMNDGSLASNWIEVGASAPNAGKTLAASFTNYGNYSVDIFAPGVDIYATLPGSKYGRRDGTSMASPVVSGVAALVLSYFPELTPEQLKEILIESGTVYTTPVSEPGSDRLVPFGALSKTGKVINAHKAIELALKKYGK